MLDTAQLVLTVAMLAVGLGFMVVAAIGFIRLPDVFCRLHVTGILDTMGAPLTLLAVGVWLMPSLASAKLVMGLLFLLLTSPLVGHLLSRAALEMREHAERGTNPKRPREFDDTRRSNKPTPGPRDPS